MSKVTRAETEAYFTTRPRESQLGAWASEHQSAVVPSRQWLEARLEEVQTRFAEQEVPAPPFWGGYRLTPSAIEFWQGRTARMHDRFRYRRPDGGTGWIIERLSP